MAGEVGPAKPAEKKKRGKAAAPASPASSNGHEAAPVVAALKSRDADLDEDDDGQSDQYLVSACHHVMCTYTIARHPVDTCMCGGWGVGRLAGRAQFMS